jgi:hypothetical protein
MIDFDFALLASPRGLTDRSSQPWADRESSVEIDIPRLVYMITNEPGTRSLNEGRHRIIAWVMAAGRSPTK